MREVMQGDASNPKVTMGNNYRPVMQIHQRTARTNINFNNPVTCLSVCVCDPMSISHVILFNVTNQILVSSSQTVIVGRPSPQFSYLLSGMSWTINVNYN